MIDDRAPQERHPALKALCARPDSAMLRDFFRTACACVVRANRTALLVSDAQCFRFVLQDLEDYTSLLDWINAQMARQEPGISSLRGFRADPARLIRHAHSWASRAAHNHNVGLLASALCLMGCGAHLLALRTQCRNCYRMSVSDAARCEEHLQAAGYLTMNTRTAVRDAERIEEKYGRAWMLIDGYCSEDELLLGVLWPEAADKGHVTKFKEAIGSVVSMCPRVKLLLPKGFESKSLKTQLAVLRDKFDPNEWRLRVWLVKLVIVEMWLDRDEELKPQRGLSRESLKVCQYSSALLSAGMQPGEICKRVGRSPARLVQLIRASGMAQA